MVEMKRWGLALLAAGCVAVAQADLVVLERNGAACSFVPAEVRRITFEDGRMCVQSLDGTTHSWEVSAVSKCYFGSAPEVPAAVGTVRTTMLMPSGNGLNVHCETAGVLTVQNVKGQLLWLRHVPVGTSMVSLADLPAGVYVVQMNGETLKLMKR